jgi:enoyl-CoA hydratase
LVGKGNAFEMILTGRMISADRAYKMGLINKVSSVESVLDEAKKIAASCIKNSPKALTAAIKCVNQSFHTNGFDFEINEFSKLFNTDEFKEGVLAFLEKRRPNY